jgi:glycosyltransferase involved in cell wall biosynthesis
MKSLVIISSQAFSLVNFRGKLIEMLVSQGVRVDVLAPDFTDALRQEVVALGATPWDYRLSRNGVTPVSDIFGMVDLVFLLRKLQPDVTLAYFIKPVIYGTLAARLARVRHRVAMIEGLGFLFTRTSKYEIWRTRVTRLVASVLYRFGLKYASKVIFLNRHDKEEFLRKKLVNPDKVLLLGGIGVDLQRWRMTPAVADPIVFLMVARLLREKGVVEYVEAAKQIKCKYPGVRFILLGGHDSNPGALSLAVVDEWVRAGVVEWHGHVDVMPWLAMASVFVLPSYREGLPRSTQEAMAMGRPIITTDVPGCRDTLEHGVNGYLIPVRDSVALAEAMLRFIDNPSLIASMGLESRRMAVERYDVDVANRKMLEFLQLTQAC